MFAEQPTFWSPAPFLCATTPPDTQVILLYERYTFICSCLFFLFCSVTSNDSNTNGFVFIPALSFLHTTVSRSFSLKSFHMWRASIGCLCSLCCTTHPKTKYLTNSSTQYVVETTLCILKRCSCFVTRLKTQWQFHAAPSEQFVVPAGPGSPTLCQLGSAREETSTFKHS